jgi:hypothetical protein
MPRNRPLLRPPGTTLPPPPLAASTFRPSCSFLRGRIPSSGLPRIICIIAFFERHTNEPTFTAFASPLPPPSPRPHLLPVPVPARAREPTHAHARTQPGAFRGPDVVLCWTCESPAVMIPANAGYYFIPRFTPPADKYVPRGRGATSRSFAGSLRT